MGRAGSGKRRSRTFKWLLGVGGAAIIAFVSAFMTQTGKGLGEKATAPTLAVPTPEAEGGVNANPIAVAAVQTSKRDGREFRVSLTGPPADIGHFLPKDNKCDRRPDGSVVLSVASRKPGKFTGCCIPVSKTFDVLPGARATINFSLDQGDRVDFKFEAGPFGTSDRIEAWIVANKLFKNTDESVSTVATEDGSTPLSEAVKGVDRFCMALLGKEGPAPNHLTVRSIVVTPK